MIILSPRHVLEKYCGTQLKFYQLVTPRVSSYILHEGPLQLIIRCKLAGCLGLCVAVTGAQSGELISLMLDRIPG